MLISAIVTMLPEFKFEVSVIVIFAERIKRGPIVLTILITSHLLQNMHNLAAVRIH